MIAGMFLGLGHGAIMGVFLAVYLSDRGIIVSRKPWEPRRAWRRFLRDGAIAVAMTAALLGSVALVLATALAPLAD